MSFSRQVLERVREKAVQTVIEANAQIADLDKTLALLDGATATSAFAYPDPVTTSPQFNQVHWGHGDVAEVVTNEPAAAPKAVEEIRAYDTTQRAELVKEIVAEDKPLLDELSFTAPPAPEPKTGGRRTNEEIAAEIGVNLEDVKEWKGGGRVSRADMEEFKKLHAGAAIPGQQTIDDVGAPEPDVEAAPGMWSESDTSGGEADTANESAKPQRVEQVSPSYGTADEAVVADDAETFEPPF